MTVRMVLTFAKVRVVTEIAQAEIDVPDHLANGDAATLLLWATSSQAPPATARGVDMSSGVPVIVEDRGPWRDTPEGMPVVTCVAATPAGTDKS